VDTALEKLAKDGKLGSKEYGKTALYWVNQDLFQVCVCVRATA
jgi:hypothetical protein